MNWEDKERVRLLAVAVARNHLVQRHRKEYRKLLKKHTKKLERWNRNNSPSGGEC